MLTCNCEIALHVALVGVPALGRGGSRLTTYLYFLIVVVLSFFWVGGRHFSPSCRTLSLHPSIRYTSEFASLEQAHQFTMRCVFPLAHVCVWPLLRGSGVGVFHSEHVVGNTRRAQPLIKTPPARVGNQHADNVAIPSRRGKLLRSVL